MREEISDEVNKTLPPAEIKKVPNDSSKWGSSLNCTFPGENSVVPSSGNFLAVVRALAYKLEDDEYMWEKVSFFFNNLITFFLLFFTWHVFSQ